MVDFIPKIYCGERLSDDKGDNQSIDERGLKETHDSVQVQDWGWRRDVRTSRSEG